MVKLTILNADESLYWQMTTNTREECDAWLAEEQTRPYWKEDFIVQIDDQSAAAAAAAAANQTAMEQKIADYQSRSDALKVLKAKETLTSEEMTQCLKLIMSQLGIFNDGE